MRNSVTVSVTGFVVPVAGVTFGIELQLAALQHALGFFFDRRPVLGRDAAQNGFDALHDQALRERLGDIVVGAHLEAEQFVDLFVLGGQEDDRHRRLLAHATQKLHAVHARHLDIEDAEIGRVFGQGFERRDAIAVGPDLVAFGFERQAQGRQDVALVVDQSDRAFLFHLFLFGPSPAGVRAARVALYGRMVSQLWRRDPMHLEA